MKLWDKGYSIDRKIESFTVGRDRELDMYLAHYDAVASKAQANMLAETGLLESAENEQLQEALDSIIADIASGDFEIEESFEDIHSKIEHRLIEKCGDAGKKIHTARSRNDQVLVAIHLFLRDFLKEVADKGLQLVDLLLEKADQHKDDLLPGYTHFQAAMPSSFGLWFSAYAENLLSDLAFVKAAYTVADQNPLGSGAGFGTSFPVNRSKTTEEMGFGSMAVSSVGAQMLRGKSEKAVAVAMAMVSSTLGKMSYDLVMYNSQDMGFVQLPDALTTGSSIMPHKKNPDVFELTRAHSNRMQALPMDITMIISNLPSGYHRDFQLLKEVLFEAMKQFHTLLDIMIYAVPQIKIASDYMAQEKYDSIYTVENINHLIKSGVPFRDAYKQVGGEVEEKTYKPHKDFKTSHEGSIHRLSLELIQEKRNKFSLDS
ncbi:MAG: argininosuccinate lyase [Weeksellaceae bacterium]|nr:argininosuccinate lyase [Weeksellaceae bacterium]